MGHDQRDTKILLLHSETVLYPFKETQNERFLHILRLLHLVTAEMGLIRMKIMTDCEKWELSLIKAVNHVLNITV
jgi:hypothetical protein